MVHTPGHASNHLCYRLEEERTLFSGDHVMSGSTVVIRPPDGDMATYLESLERVKGMRLRKIAPGHGHVIEDPQAVLDHYLSHRAEREAAILATLQGEGSASIDRLVEVVYTDVDAERHPIVRQVRRTCTCASWPTRATSVGTTVINPQAAWHAG